MDILLEVTHSGTNIKRDNFRVTYKNVLVAMLHDKMYSVFPIHDGSSEYSDLYIDLITLYNLHILLASKEYACKRNWMWQFYPDNGRRKGLIELVAVYNVRNKKHTYF